MAQLSSPGVSVEVKDDSMYSTAAAGTIPLIFVATAANKLDGSLTGIAPGTLKTDKDYGKVRLFTSPKDLTDTFGIPVFKTDSNNNPIHGAEQNEYGLQAAYKYLNISNRAFVVRADLDLDELKAVSTIPVGAPSNNTFWLDTASTNWGIFVWNSQSAEKIGGQTFTHVEPLVITEATKIDEFGAPRSGFGSVGSYAIVAVSSLITLWYKSKKSSAWHEVGSDDWNQNVEIVETTISELTFATPLSTTSDSITITTYSPTGALVKTYPPFTGDSLALIAKNINDAAAQDGVSATAEDYKLQIYSKTNDVSFAGTNAATAAKIGLDITTPLYLLPAFDIASHLEIPKFKRTDLKNSAVGRPTGSVWVKTTATNNGADWNINRYDSDVKAWITSSAPVYPTNADAIFGLDPSTGGLEIAGNTVYVKYNTSQQPTDHANFKLFRRVDTGKTEIVSKLIRKSDWADNTTYKFDMYETIAASNLLVKKEIEININYNPADPEAQIVEYILDELEARINTSVVNTNVQASQMNGKLVITHIRGGDIEFDDGQNSPITKLFSATATDTNVTANFYHHPNGSADMFVASLWSEYGTSDRTSSFIKASPTKLTGPATDGQLWYDANFDIVDIMVKDDNDWVAYRNYDHGSGRGATNKKGPILSASEPETQNDTAKSPLVEGDLWIDTSDTENYPVIYKYANYSKKWVKVNNADQTTEDGIVFADARWNTNGVSETPATIEQLLGGTESELSTEAINAANFLDFDAPNPASYPKGILLWNLRRSGYNVKKYHKKYVDVLSYNVRNGESMRNYYPNRWVTESGNNENGSGTFGRKAQRKVVVQSLQALVNSNQQIREEEYRVFNLIACPGYPELVGEMVQLNVARGQTAFVIGDSPARLKSDATSLLEWGSNENLAVQDSDEGLVTFDPYLAFFYPWGYTSDNKGNNVVVPPSHMMLTTIALSDAASFPWFAPAGTQRGAIKTADSVGYLGPKDEWVPVALNVGQRDTLASIKVNPITYLAGAGLVNYGQYTRSPDASALDRINVARLVVHLRRRLDVMSRPYLFQPNDDATRKQIKHAAESMLLELMGQRAIYDYVVVCDSSNNTPSRIDKSELYLDIAIEPTKAVEFIYIPLRLKNTGEIKAMGI